MCEKPGSYFQGPFVNIEIGRMQTVLKSFEGIVASQSYHYPAPLLAKIGKILGSHSGKSAVNFVSPYNFSGAGYGVLNQLGIIYQHGVPPFNFKCCQDAARPGHTFDQFFKAFYDLFANVRIQGSEGSSSTASSGMIFEAVPA